MANPSGPVNGQNRVVEGLVLTDGTVAFRRGRNATAVTSADDNAADQTMSWPAAVRVAQTPTVSTSPAYTAKDAVGGLLTFAAVAQTDQKSGVVTSVTIQDNSQQRPSLELVLFNQTFTASTDNAVFDPSDADLANVVGVIAVNSWSDFNDNSVATVTCYLPYVLTGTSLFGQLVTRGTPTFVATSDIVVTITASPD